MPENKKNAFLAAAPLLAAFLAALALSALLIYKGGLPGPAGDQADRRILRVLTYSSFAGVYGPGRKLKKQFEKSCRCEVQWLLSEDSTALLQRLAIVPSADLIAGLDQISAREGGRSLKWKSLASLRGKILEDLPLSSSPFFIPIDWAPAGFLYKSDRGGLKSSRGADSRRGQKAAGGPLRPPLKPDVSAADSRRKSRSGGLAPHQISSLSQLPGIQGKISFPEPRTSVLGMQLYYWIYDFFSGDLGRIRRFLLRLKPKIYGPVFSWSLSYGFFQKGRVDMSLSYLTSLIYHMEEGEREYRFARFTEGHPIHVEFAAVPESCASCLLALEFVRFLLSPAAQAIIMKSHYMLPAGRGALAGAFAELKPPKMISYKSLDQFISQKKRLLALWEEALH